MARGLLNIAGGLLTGVGQGLVAQEAQRQKLGLEQREARRRELERQQDQDFRKEERVAGQDFQAGQAELTRGAAAERDAAGHLQALELQDRRATSDAEQKRLDREAQANDPLRKAQADYYTSGGAAGQKLVPVEIDDPDNPGQKITVYKSAADAADQRVGSRPGAGGRDSVYEQKRRAWLALHPDDETGALDYAAGKKVTNDTGLYEMASKIVARENSGALVPMKPDERQKRVEETYRYLQGLNKGDGSQGAPAAGNPAAAPSPQAAPTPAAPTAPRTDPAEVQRLRDRASQAISAGGDAAAVRARFKALTGQEL